MRRVAIVAMQLALGILVAEVLLHLWNPIPFRVKGNHIVLRRHDTNEFRNPASDKLDAHVRYRTNSLGFRGPEPPRDLAARLSILTVGGSTTGCFLLNDGDTWPDRLSAQLGREFPRLWLDNAGIDGQSTYGHLTLMRDYVVHIRPRVVVFLIGINDVALSASNWFDARVTDQVVGRHELAADWLVTHSELAAIAQNAWRAWRARAYGLTQAETNYSALPEVGSDAAAAEQQARAGVPAFAARVAELIDVSRSQGILPVLVTQPALYGDGRDPSTGIDFSQRRVNDVGGGDAAWRMLEFYNAATRTAGANAHLVVIDLARELPKDSRYFYDFVHFSKAGAAKVADIVYAHLRPALVEWCRTGTIAVGCERQRTNPTTPPHSVCILAVEPGVLVA